MSNDISPLVLKIAAALEKSHQSLALAESCTGGLVSTVITRQAGVSSFFKGSVISYANSAKAELLGVPEHLLNVMGAVSEPVAKYMARGVRKQFGSDWAVSITGIAGPGGGQPDKPVGTVCFAVVGPGIEVFCRQQFENNGREFIQKASAEFALEYLWTQIHQV